MSAGSGASVSVAAGDLARFVARAFERLGVPEPDAWSVAELMVEADLRGYDTHGVFRRRQYVNRLRDGGINPRPRLAVVTEGAAMALIDGDNGLGHLALRRATELAIEKADAGLRRSRSVRQHGGRGVRPDAGVRAAARP